jgi:hypothetical protein
MKTIELAAILLAATIMFAIVVTMATHPAESILFDSYDGTLRAMDGSQLVRADEAVKPTWIVAKDGTLVKVLK